jgi:hypothetical protein
MDPSTDFLNANINLVKTEMTLFQKIIKKMIIPFIMLITINIVFAFIYLFCNQPEDWNGMDDENDSFAVKLFKRLYFSMTTFSTVGYGDISPASIRARSIVMIQFVFILFELLSTLM